MPARVNDVLVATDWFPPNPWEQAGGLNAYAPFKPALVGSNNNVVEAPGIEGPWEIVSTTQRTVTVNRNVIYKTLHNMPWEQQTYGRTYGDSGLKRNLGYYSGMHGSIIWGI
ncbi:hypothetical protein V6N12_009374 [Hibiscus sabdariffa]|uniref:Peroxin-13 n=1 Tax=Hibiscus sabdariffa TaxID=183260 RepID=A0ABR2EAH6_9ROSI